MNDDCVFCRIIEGRIPSTEVLRTDDVLAFLDIGPIVKGHVLVIPREHFECLPDLPADVLHRVMEVVQRVSAALFKEFKADGVNVFQANGAAAGQVVPHVHFHVIPRFNDDGHHWNWKSKTYDNPAEATALGERLRAALSD